MTNKRNEDPIVVSKPNGLPEDVKNFLVKEEFCIDKIYENTRYVLLKASNHKYKTPVMIKLEGGNSRNSLQQRNHILWTDSVVPQIPARSPFDVAPILDSGCIGEVWHWFVTPFIEGEPFASIEEEGLTNISVAKPEEIISKIVDLMRWLQGVTAKSVAGLDGRYGNINSKTKNGLIESAVQWARNDTPYLADLLQIISANAKYLKQANAHGDFTELNIIINNKREPVLIDAEISNAYHFKFYDVAEFYNRIFTRSCEPELAKLFLQTYFNSLPKRSKKEFLNNFLCISALRCIGTFMETGSLQESKGKTIRLKYTKMYAEEITSYRILNLKE